MPVGKRRTVVGVPACQRPRPYSSGEVGADGSTWTRANNTFRPRTPNQTRQCKERQYEAHIGIPSGRFFPFFLGMYVRRAGFH